MSMPNVIIAGKYTWIRPEGEYLVVGLNENILHEFGEVASVDLPEVGDEVEEGDDLLTVETYQGMVDIYSPIGGQVVEVNDEICDTSDLINMDPYGSGWLLIMGLDEGADMDSLISRKMREKGARREQESTDLKMEKRNDSGRMPFLE